MPAPFAIPPRLAAEAIAAVEPEPEQHSIRVDQLYRNRSLARTHTVVSGPHTSNRGEVWGCRTEMLTDATNLDPTFMEYLSTEFLLTRARLEHPKINILPGIFYGIGPVDGTLMGHSTRGRYSIEEAAASGVYDIVAERVPTPDGHGGDPDVVCVMKVVWRRGDS
jgi:hypothetical protein